jgi:hypothetical protein
MASLSGYQKIVLKANYTDGGAQHEEGICATAPATPGMNVNITTAAETIGRHSYAPGPTPVGGTAAGAAAGAVNVVKEPAETGGTIDTAVAVGDNLMIHKCLPGDHIQVLVASGQTVLKGDLGWAIAGGKWNAATVSINGIVQFLEGSGGALAADKHMRAKVL